MLICFRKRTPKVVTDATKTVKDTPKTPTKPLSGNINLSSPGATPPKRIFAKSPQSPASPVSPFKREITGIFLFYIFYDWIFVVDFRYF